MFKPKTFLDVCFAMRMEAEVEVGGQRGRIVAIRREGGFGCNWTVEIAIGTCDVVEVFFVEA